MCRLQTMQRKSEQDLPPLLANQAIDPRNAYVMHSMLRDVVRRGTGIRARRELGRSDIAGKTGTTNDAADTWFNGYHPNVATTVWVGFPQSSGPRRGGVWLQPAAADLDRLHAGSAERGAGDLPRSTAGRSHPEDRPGHPACSPTPATRTPSSSSSWPSICRKRRHSRHRGSGGGAEGGGYLLGCAL